MNKTRWQRLREAAAGSTMPALERPGTATDPDNDDDDDTGGPPGDTDTTHDTCPSCQGTGIKGAGLCTKCGGTGTLMAESDPGGPVVCATCLTADCGATTVERIREANLTAAQRKGLDKSKFAVPEKAPGSGSYPIPDAAHIGPALAYSEGTADEGRVKSYIKQHFPHVDMSEAGIANFGKKKAPPKGKDAKDSKDGKDAKDAKDDDKPPWLQSKEADDLRGRIEALEATTDVFRSLREAKPASMVPTFSTPKRVKSSDGAEGYAVVLIKEGRGNTEDDQWYTAASIKELCESGVAEGMQAFGNHPTEDEEEDRPERDVKELVGTYHDVKFAESAGPPRAEAVFVPLTMDEHHPRYGWVVTLAEAAIRSNAPQPICGISLYGLSAGDDGDRPDGSHGRIVSLIRPQSGDIVTNAGAGGGFIRQLMESARALRNRSRKELTPMQALAYQTQMREAVKRVREATSDEDRTAALDALTALESEKIDSAPDSIEQLREAAPKLVDEITSQAKAAGDQTIEELKEANKKLTDTLGSFTSVIGITDALREAGVKDQIELRYFVGKAQERGLREAADIADMVKTERDYSEMQRQASVEAMREVFGDPDDPDIEGNVGRVPVASLPTDGGVSTLREAGIPILDAE